MSQQRFWHELMVLILVLALLLSALAACDDDDSDDTPTAAATATVPVKAAVANPTVSDEPVKIGFTLDWSGPAAMAGFMADGAIQYVEWLVNEKQGGVIDGRPLEILKGDDKSQPMQGAAVATRLVDIDHVSAICGGGVVEPIAYAVADVTDPAGVPFFLFQAAPELFDDYNCTVATLTVWDGRGEHTADYIVNTLRPETIGYLSDQSQRVVSDLIKRKVSTLNAEIETVLDERYPLDTMDFSAYLTRVKYEEPDVLAVCGSKAGYIAMSDQITELGGLGDTQVFCVYESALDPATLAAQGSQGWYVMAVAHEDRASFNSFKQLWSEKCAQDADFHRKYKNLPIMNVGIMVSNMMTAVEAIRLAGSDNPADVASAARSGELELDLPIGHLTITTDGKNTFFGEVIRIQDHDAVPMEKPLSPN